MKMKYLFASIILFISCKDSEIIDPFNHLGYELGMSKDNFITNTIKNNTVINDTTCFKGISYYYYNKPIDNVVISCGKDIKVAGYFIDNKSVMIWITYFEKNESINELYKQRDAEVQNYKNAKSFFKNDRDIECSIQIIDELTDIVLIDHKQMISDTTSN